MTLAIRSVGGRLAARNIRSQGLTPEFERSLVGRETRVVVQGITGKEGTFHALRCKEYGTQVVGGVTPGKGGTVHEGFPVWNTVDEAVREAGADCALIFVPPVAAADAIMEAAAAGVPLVVCITEGIPVGDMVRAKAFLAEPRDAAPRARTAPGSSRPARPRSASCPATSTGRAGWAWCRGAGP